MRFAEHAMVRVQLARDQAQARARRARLGCKTTITTGTAHQPVEPQVCRVVMVCVLMRVGRQRASASLAGAAQRAIPTLMIVRRTSVRTVRRASMAPTILPVYAHLGLLGNFVKSLSLAKCQQTLSSRGRWKCRRPQHGAMSRMCRTRLITRQRWRTWRFVA